MSRLIVLSLALASFGCANRNEDGKFVQSMYSRAHESLDRSILASVGATVISMLDQDAHTVIGGERTQLVKERAIAVSILGRELAYVTCNVEPVTGKSLDEEFPTGLVRIGDYRQKTLSLAGPNRRVAFDETKYDSHLRQILSDQSYSKLITIRNRWGYFDKLKQDYQ